MEFFLNYIQTIEIEKQTNRPPSPVLQIQHQLYKLSSLSHLQIFIPTLSLEPLYQRVGEAYEAANHIWNGLE